MRKIPLAIGAFFLLVGLGIVTGIVKSEIRIIRPLLSTNRTLESPLTEWSDSVNVLAGETVVIAVACREAGDRVLVGLLAKAVFEAGGPWGEDNFLVYSSGRDVSVSYTQKAPEMGTYYFVVQGIEIEPIPFDVTVTIETKRPYEGAPYIGMSFVVVGVVLILLSWYRVKR